MKNLEIFQEQFRVSLDVRDMFESAKPFTPNGINLVESYSTNLNKGKIFNFLEANQFLKQAHNIMGFDAEVKGLYDRLVTTFEGKPFKTRLAMVGESVMGVQNNKMVDALKHKVDELLSLEESEVKARIRNNVLDIFKTNPMIASIIEQANDNIKIVDAKKSIVYNPITFVEESEAGYYARMGDYVVEFSKDNFRLITDNEISQRFKYLSGIVEKAKFNSVDESFMFETAFGKYSIKDGAIAKHNDSNEVTEVSVQEFSHNTNVIIESKRGANKPQLLGIADAIVALRENFEDVTKLDNCRVVETAELREKVVLVDHAGRYGVLVTESIRHQRGFKYCKNVTEAVAVINKLTGVDLKEHYTDAISMDLQIKESSTKAIDKQEALVENLENRLESVKETMKTLDEKSKSYAQYNEAYELTKGLIVAETTKLTDMKKQ